MSPIWSEWLGELAREGKAIDDAGVPLAMRGYEWRMRVAVEGNFTGYQLIGRVKIAPDAATDLAVMAAFGPVFESGQTFWEMSLPNTGANSTTSLPMDADGDAVVKLPFLLTMVPPTPGMPYPLLGGRLTLIGAI